MYLLLHLPDTRGYVRQALGAADDLLAGVYPSVDLALLLLERDMALPDRTAVFLFYLGRLAGWIAHVMEQYSQDRPIRPRARYVGRVPEDRNE